MIEFRPSPDQVQIIDSIAGYLQRQFPVERLLSRTAPPARARAAWSELAEQGFFGLAAPEDIGGAGFTVIEEMLAHRAFGRALLSPGVLAAALAVDVALADADVDLAASLVAGEQPVAIGLARSALALTGAAAHGDLHLIDSEPGDLVLVRAEEGLALLRCDDLAGVEPVDGIDESLSLHRARGEGAQPVAFAPASAAPLARKMVLLIAAAQVGMAEATRDLAVEHARIREQFGKPIGSFQGVAHHCADMEVRARAARAQTAFAAMALRDGRGDADFHVSAAAVTASDAAIRNATMAIRVLGGMGFTAECALHLYLKRAHLYERLGGGVRRHQRDLLRRDGEAILAGA